MMIVSRHLRSVFLDVAYKLNIIIAIMRGPTRIRYLFGFSPPRLFPIYGKYPARFLAGYCHYVWVYQCCNGYLPRNHLVQQSYQGTVNKGKKSCMFLYSAVSSLLDRIKRFTLHRLADLFIPKPNQLLSEAFQPCSNYARRLLTQISAPVYSQVLVYTAE